MIRFIFLCMAVVALSFVTLGAQSLMDSMGDAQTSVMARNAQTTEPSSEIAATEKSTINQDETELAAALNDITTAAGADQPDTGFGDAFTNMAPKALAENPIINTPSTDIINEGF